MKAARKRLESNLELGTLTLATVSDDEDAIYRVEGAVVIQGALSLEIDLIIGPAGSDSVHTEALPAGSYTVELLDGYQLQKEVDGEYVDVDSELISESPIPFVVAPAGPRQDP